MAVKTRARLTSSGFRDTKRHILVDTNALVLGVRVHGADLLDPDGGRRLLAEGLERGLFRMELVRASGAYSSGFREWAEEERGCRVEVPHHRDRQLWRYGLWRRSRSVTRCYLAVG